MPNNPKVIRRPEVIWPGRKIDPGIVPSSERHLFERVRDVEQEKAEIGEINLTEPVADDDILVFDADILPSGAWVNAQPYITIRPAVTGRNVVQPTADAHSLRLRRFASGQTNPVQTWETEGGTALARVDPNGAVQGYEMRCGGNSNVSAINGLDYAFTLAPDTNQANAFAWAGQAGIFGGNTFYHTLDFYGYNASASPTTGYAWSLSSEGDYSGAAVLSNTEFRIDSGLNFTSAMTIEGTDNKVYFSKRFSPTPDGQVSVEPATAGTKGITVKLRASATANGMELQNSSAGLLWDLTPAGNLEFRRTSSTTEGRLASWIKAELATAVDASRTGRGTLYATDFNGDRECLRWEADGSAAMIGFLGASAVARQGNTTDLKDVIVNFGFLTDGGATPLNLDGGTLTAGTITGDWTGGVTLTPSTDTRNVIQPTAATVKALVLKGAVSQSDNLQEWQDSGGTAMIAVSSGGEINMLGGTAFIVNYSGSRIIRVLSAATWADSVTAGFFQSGQSQMMWTGNNASILSRFAMSSVCSQFSRRSHETFPSPLGDSGVVEILGSSVATGQALLGLRGVSGQTGPFWQGHDASGNLLASCSAVGAGLFNGRDAVTNAVTTVLTLGHNTSGTAAAGFGNRTLYRLESSTTEDRDAATLDVTWVTATDASRAARAVCSVFDTAAREIWRGEASGTAPMIGFLGASAVARTSAYTPTNVTTDRSYDANATTLDELADVVGTLIADLQAFGLLG